MASVYDYARALTKAMRECEQFQRMKKLGAKVKADRKLDGLLAEFRLRQYEAQAIMLQGKQPGKSQLEQLQKLANAMEAEQLLKDYMASETAYGQVLVEVQDILHEVYNPDVPGAVGKKS